MAARGEKTSTRGRSRAAAAEPETEERLLSNGDPVPEGLYAKIAYVMGQVEHVPKNGFNKHFKYHFVREVDLTEHLRPLLSEMGLVIVPSATDNIRILEHADGDQNKRITLIFYNFKIVDADTGDSEIMGVWGGGQDGQDKGPYKALTGADKYALMKLFMVPTGDDPEATDGEGNSTAEGKPRRERKRRRSRDAEAETEPAEAGQEEEEQEEEEEEEEKPKRRRRGAKAKAEEKEEAKKKRTPSEEEEDALLEKKIKESQKNIAEACDTLDDAIADEEYPLELTASEASNKEAAAQLVIQDLADRPRYLKALTRAETYLEKLIEKYSEEEDEEE
jgi:hypothetical protein